MAPLNKNDVKYTRLPRSVYVQKVETWNSWDRENRDVRAEHGDHETYNFEFDWLL